MRKKNNLNPMQTNAVNALFENGFKSQKAALREAKYNEGTSTTSVFGNPKVKAEIEQRRQALARKHDVKQDQIIAELKKIGFTGVGDLIKVDDEGKVSLDFTKLTDAHRAAIEQIEVTENPITGEVKTKVKFISKLGALNDLSRHLDLFNQDKGTSDLLDAIARGRKRVRIQIDDDPNA